MRYIKYDPDDNNRDIEIMQVCFYNIASVVYSRRPRKDASIVK